MVVDDEPTVTEVARISLKRADHRVVVASDGREALGILENQSLDLVVLDLTTPEVNGLETTRWLRARGSLPIIMLTARQEEVDRILGLELEADDYVVKPFSPQGLISRVKAVHVHRLREKIEADPSNPRHIQTLWGVGYKFEPEAFAALRNLATPNVL